MVMATVVELAAMADALTTLILWPMLQMETHIAPHYLLSLPLAALNGRLALNGKTHELRWSYGVLDRVLCAYAGGCYR